MSNATLSKKPRRSPPRRTLRGRHREDLLKALKGRFEKNMNRHKGLHNGAESYYAAREFRGSLRV